MKFFFIHPRACLYRAVLLVVAFSTGGLMTVHADAPSNNDLANAQVLPAGSFSVSGTEVGASQESFEQSSNFPYTYGNDLNASVWYSWTPTAAGMLQIAAINDSDNGDSTAVLVFTAPGTPSNATFVGSNSPSNATVTAIVAANQQYLFFVGNEGAYAHPFTLNGTFTPQTTPTPPPTTEPSVTLVVKTPKVSRSSSTVGKVLVELSSAATTALTISYKTSGTAVPGTDYNMLSGSVTVPVGATKATLKIKPLSGGTGTLAVKLTVTAGTGYTLGSSAKGKVKIVD